MNAALWEQHSQNQAISSTSTSMLSTKAAHPREAGAARAAQRQRMEGKWIGISTELRQESKPLEIKAKCLMKAPFSNCFKLFQIKSSYSKLFCPAAGFSCEGILQMLLFFEERQEATRTMVFPAVVLPPLEYLTWEGSPSHLRFSLESNARHEKTYPFLSSPFECIIINLFYNACFIWSEISFTIIAHTFFWMVRSPEQLLSGLYPHVYPIPLNGEEFQEELLSGLGSLAGREHWRLAAFL